MLSHHSNLQMPPSQQRIHRRQQSTPTTFEVHQSSSSTAPKAIPQHRRGMSLVTQGPSGNNQDFEQVGITNTGQQAQHSLQVAQQQHNQAQPGHQQTIIEEDELSEEEFRRLQHQQLDAQLNSLFRRQPASRQQYGPVRMEKSRSNPEHAFLQALQTSPIQGQSGLFLSPDEPRQTQARPVSAHGSYEIERGRAQEPRNLWHLQRPFTPSNQSNHDQFLLTPETSPHSNDRVQEQINNPDTSSPRYCDKDATIRASQRHAAFHSKSLPVNAEYADPNATIRANIQDNGANQPSYLDMFVDSPTDQSVHSIPSPPNTAPTKTIRKFDATAMSQGLQLADVPKLDLPPADGDEGNVALQLSPQLSTVSIEKEQVTMDMDFEYASSPARSFHSARSSVDFGSVYGSPNRGMLSPSTMSMNELNLDAAVEDTGISAEEVQSYMSDQDVTTGKWTCLYSGCGKTFGRRENIKSHIQTHLGDRQFKCLHCNKKFVRQHDLKRHSKIHSGVKPYPCACGNSFARHDALTRHRQRGICNGGFEGIVKKVVKRGRPRKNRPNDDDRMDKASRTRKRVEQKSNASSTSTASEYSFSDSSPPPMLLEGLDNSSDPLGQLLTAESMQLPNDFFSYTESHVSSPQSIEEVPSPDKTSTIDWAATPPTQNLDDQPAVGTLNPQETVSLAEMSQQTQTGSQPCSQPGSPPGLSHSSPPLSAKLLDVDSRSGLRSAGTDCAGGLQLGEAGSSFDMFASDNTNDLFGSSWNASSYFNYDKSSSDLRMDDYSSSNFCDEALFSDDVHGNNGLM